MIGGRNSNIIQGAHKKKSIRDLSRTNLCGWSTVPESVQNFGARDNSFDSSFDAGTGGKYAAEDVDGMVGAEVLVDSKKGSEIRVGW